jgi:hypothetical protein
MSNFRLKANKLNNITYFKESTGETTDRVIIPLGESTVRAIDVSDLEQADRIELLSSWNEYQQYVKEIYKSVPSFETWCEKNNGAASSVKWRRFHVDNVRVKSVEK